MRKIYEIVERLRDVFDVEPGTNEVHIFVDGKYIRRRNVVITMDGENISISEVSIVE